MYLRVRLAISWLFLVRLVLLSPSTMPPRIHLHLTTSFGAKVLVRLIWSDLVLYTNGDTTLAH